MTYALFSLTSFTGRSFCVHSTKELATAMAKPEGAEEATEAPSERQQMLDLSQHLFAA